MNSFLLASEHWRHHGDGWFPLFPLVFIAIWIAVIFTLRRRWRRGWQFNQGGESVLAERYARGEIDEAEFRNRRKVLREKD
jgi:putative membrane protein